jgi:hypothetical protein
MRWLKVFGVMAVFAAFGVGVIHADDAVPTFSDGRVNNWQMDEPVAVYCVFDNTADINVGVFQRIEAWGLDGNKLLEASAAQIAAAPANSTLATNNGYTLDKLAANTFQVSGPNGYVFTWSRGDTNC